jgi:hypothetical protein
MGRVAAKAARLAIAKRLEEWLDRRRREVGLGKS